jgi:hypothetical protein
VPTFAAPWLTRRKLHRQAPYCVRLIASGFAASRLLAAHNLRQTDNGRWTVGEFEKLNEFENL